MVAYSFPKCFIDPILSGRKAQTIRGDRRRHARPGEELQLYSGMRTRSCRLIGRATCRDIRPFKISVTAVPFHWRVQIGEPAQELYWCGLPPEYDGPWAPGEGFAQADGFRSERHFWIHWRQFCADEPVVDTLFGWLIRWSDFQPGPDFDLSGGG